MNNADIDFVLPWVNPNDLSWHEERLKYDINHNQNDKKNITRFRDMDTLKYVLRSIEKYCPWYNKIYLITTGHIPEWLDISHPKIILVTHEELFIDKTALPVFNSNAIEMNLVNIKGLSEKFVYLNDDTIIWKHLKEERFFINDKPVDFFHHAWIPRNKIFEWIKGKDNWVDAINNNIELINSKANTSKMTFNTLYHSSYSLQNKISNFLYRVIYKKLFWINHWHHPQPYLKNTIKEVYRIYHREMRETSKYKFRTSNDITPYLYRYWHLTQGEFQPIYHNDGVIAQISSFRYLENIIRHIEEDKSINFVCFNDQMNFDNQCEFEAIKQSLGKYLNEKFPYKASFEIVNSRSVTNSVSIR